MLSKVLLLWLVGAGRGCVAVGGLVFVGLVGADFSNGKGNAQPIISRVSKKLLLQTQMKQQ